MDQNVINGGNFRNYLVKFWYWRNETSEVYRKRATISMLKKDQNQNQKSKQNKKIVL